MSEHEPTIVRFKLLWADAKPPLRLPGDAGWDLSLHHKDKDEISQTVMMGTGVAVEIPPHFFGLVRPRSSIAKTGYQFCSSGVIDPSYRGEIVVPLKFNGCHDDECAHLYNIGDRIAQLLILPLPDVALVQVDSLSKTMRGSGGFGSTGR